MRKLRLPKIGPTKTKSLFEEYFYALLAVVFVAVAILGKAGGFNGFNALVVGAWITAALWFASQWRSYFAEKEKAANGKLAPEAAAARTEASKGPMALPPGMKPMIGPQWPVKTALWPARPEQSKRWPKPAALEAPEARPAAVQDSSSEAPPAPNDPNKKVFTYERPTLPDRKPKLPHNWKKTDKKKPKR